MSTAPQSLPPNLGKYQVRREVGRGGMGVVYEGYDPVINRRVALKTLISELFSGPQADDYLARLRREAQAAGRLNHPHIVAIYDFGEESVQGPGGAMSRAAFIAMEFIDGRELKSYFDANERFPMAGVARIMGELLDALAYSHGQGVVHRDIKPANILLLTDGCVKVADFGIARIESSTLTQAGTVLGSPSYMSPEQFMGQTVDGRSDLYSAAVVLYQLLTGEVPFTGSFSNVMHRVLNEEPAPPSILNVQVPRAFDAVVRRGMAKRPDERYQTAGEFKQAIMAASSGSAAASAPAGAGQDPNQATQMRPTAAADSRPARSSAWRVGLPLAALCLAAVAAAGFLWIRPHAPAPSAAAPSSAAPSSASSSRAISTGPAAAGHDTGGGVDSGATPAVSWVAPPGTAVISAVGLADPTDPQTAHETAAIERMVWGDARRQLIAKAVALYIDPSSINAHYAALRSTLLARSDEYIATVLEQMPPQISPYGLMIGTLRATVKVRAVQKALNQLSRDDRIEFIRNNGNPRIAVNIRTMDAGDAAPTAQRSAVAENVLKEQIRSFGFVTVDDQLAKPAADFFVDGEVRFKRLSATLPASGLTIEKFALTSWTVRAVDVKSGEEIYHNTTIPAKKSWASEELALQDIGRLISAEFSRDFFLQYFDFDTKKVRLRFTGLPASAAAAVLPEINATLQVLNAGAVKQDGDDVVIDAELSGAGSVSATDLIQTSLLASLNRKLGQNCFTIAGADAAQVDIRFEAACLSGESLKRLESLPPQALMDSPALRIEDVVKNPKTLGRIKT
jgi:eukaryotic-like serine/threonine-protein kinase